MKKVEIPTNCPSCNSTLERVNDQLFCRNPSCGAVSAKKIIHFAKTMKIKGLGVRTLEKLEIGDINDLYNLDKDFVSSKIGEKTADKVLAEIEKSKKVPVSQFLASFSIPLIGQTASKKILTNKIEDITYESARGYGLGDKAATNLINWIEEEYHNYYELPIELTIPEPEQDSKYTVCITGTIPGYTRATINNALSDLNVRVSSTVTAKTTHLICNKRKGSSKEVKAEEMGIPIMTFDEFKEILNNG